MCKARSIFFQEDGKFTDLLRRSNIVSQYTARRISSLMHILDLPYDVRHQIYHQLFPPGESIYIQALPDKLRVVSVLERIPVELFLTSRLLYLEASGYLYNGYLYNIIGTKRNCLRNYRGFLSTVHKHAWNEVHVDAFGNGAHSSTMCVSIHVGEAMKALLRRRERGEPKKIRDLEQELASSNRGLRLDTLHTLALGFALFAFAITLCLTYVRNPIPWT